MDLWALSSHLLGSWSAQSCDLHYSRYLYCTTLTLAQLVKIQQNSMRFSLFFSSCGKLFPIILKHTVSIKLFSAASEALFISVVKVELEKRFSEKLLETVLRMRSKACDPADISNASLLLWSTFPRIQLISLLSLIPLTNAMLWIWYRNKEKERLRTAKGTFSLVYPKK